MPVALPQPLVRAHHARVDALAAHASEPAFVALPGATLHLSIDGDAGRAMLDFLAHRIRHSRGDLLSHARRVLLAHRLGDAAASCAAMLDLACALQGKGEALRRMLFNEIAEGLQAGQRELLSMSLARVPHDDECEAVRGTLLRPLQADGALVRVRQRPCHDY